VNKYIKMTEDILIIAMRVWGVELMCWIEAAQF